MIPAVKEQVIPPQAPALGAPGEVLLPGFISKTSEGLMVDAAKGSAEDVLRFVDRVFNSNACLYQLDYALMQALIYGEDQRPTGIVRLAGLCNFFSVNFQGGGHDAWFTG